MDAKHTESLPVASSTQKSTIWQLSQMGFALRKVLAAMDYTGSGRVDEVLDFLTKGDDGWRHPFLRSAYTANEGGELCVLCEEPLGEHQEKALASREQLSRSLSSVHLLVSRRNSAPSQLQSEPKCPICLETVVDAWRLPACSDHCFCCECVRRYIATSVLDGRDVKCPGEKCRCVFAIEEVATFVGQDAAAKYAEKREKAILAQDPTVKWCRTRDCAGYVRQSPEASTAQCPICSVAMCTFCGEKAHSGVTCDAVVDREIEAWTAAKAVKRCPQCTRLVEKDEGCDHMTCAACLHEWCWLCLSPFAPEHFVEDGPGYCPVLAANEASRPVRRGPRNCCKSFGCGVLVTMALVLLFPVMLAAMLLVLPWVVAIVVPKEKLRGQRCKQVLVGVLLWVLVVAVDPVAAIVALIVLDGAIVIQMAIGSPTNRL